MQATPLPGPLITFNALGRCLSYERLSAYSVETDFDSVDALARYLWNGALCAAFQPALHALEITLRNSLYKASDAVVPITGRKVLDVKCWLDLKPSYLLIKEQEKVEEAKNRLGSNPKYRTPGRLISKLGFGFWVNLLHKPYDQGRPDGPKLWPKLVPVIFPSTPKSHKHRAFIYDRLAGIRDFRNRIAHHEPIWDRDVLRIHSEVLESIGWMNPPMQRAVQACYDVAILHSNGPANFRPMAKKLLGISSGGS